jgi:hypothetical protein
LPVKEIYTIKNNNAYKNPIGFLTMETQEEEGKFQEDVVLGIFSFINPNSKTTRDPEKIHRALYSLKKKYTNSRLLGAFNFNEEGRVPYCSELSLALWRLSRERLIESYGTEYKGYHMPSTLAKSRFRNNTLDQSLVLSPEELKEIEAISHDFYEILKV